jgi:hypothetical protein
MLFWPRSRRERAERIEAEAEALIRSLGADAYSVARLREDEASSEATARYWNRVALAVASGAGRRVEADSATGTEVEAGFTANRGSGASPPRAPVSEVRPVENQRTLAAKPQPFRIQFLGAAPDHAPSILQEVEIQASDASAAIVAASNITWPPRTIGLRILDREGREVFSRHKADRG